MEIQYTDKNGNKRRYYPEPDYYSLSPSYKGVKPSKKRKIKVTNYFVNRILKWIDHENDFKHIKKYKKKIKSDDGYELIYKLINKYLKIHKISWYDIKPNYFKIKDYLRFNLIKLENI